MDNVVLSAAQLIQLASFGPCLFIGLYLLFSKNAWRQSVVAAMCFFSFGAMFLLPILQSLPQGSVPDAFLGTIMLLEQFIPELSFLLIVQFIRGKVPAKKYWVVLLIPLFASTPIIYQVLHASDVCLDRELCYQPQYVLDLVGVFSASAVFGFLVWYMHKRHARIDPLDSHKNTKYWLIIVMMMFNLIRVAFDLFAIAGALSAEQASFLETMVGVVFVYLAFSSIFRVFSENFGLRPIAVEKPKVFTLKDQDIVDHFEQVIHSEKPYRAQGVNRHALAELIGVKEHQLSKALNQKYNKSFSELMNEYRVNEARLLLQETNDSITAISYDTGFSSIASFNRVFKNLTGESPTNYRKQHKKK